MLLGSFSPVCLGWPYMPHAIFSSPGSPNQVAALFTVNFCDAHECRGHWVLFLVLDGFTHECVAGCRRGSWLCRSARGSPAVGAGLVWADPGWPSLDSCALPHVVADPSAGQPGLVHVGATLQGPPWALAWNQYATLQPKQVTGSAQIKREGCRSHLPREGEELRLLW